LYTVFYACQSPGRVPGQTLQYAKSGNIGEQTIGKIWNKGAGFAHPDKKEKQKPDWRYYKEITYPHRRA
jgi:hypothetical protein